jgi:hypothetical protein
MAWRASWLVPARRSAPDPASTGSASFQETTGIAAHLVDRVFPGVPIRPHAPLADLARTNDENSRAELLNVPRFRTVDGRLPRGCSTRKPGPERGVLRRPVTGRRRPWRHLQGRGDPRGAGCDDGRLPPAFDDHHEPEDFGARVDGGARTVATARLLSIRSPPVFPARCRRLQRGEVLRARIPRLHDRGDRS